MDVPTEVERVAEALSKRYPSTTADVVVSLVQSGFDSYAGAAITSFVPVLVQRSVESTLKQRMSQQDHSLDLRLRQGTVTVGAI